jgi:dTDP-4-amino-4,6-dideoxygalactose transaminase
MPDDLRPEPIPFIDLVSQRRRLGRAIEEAIARVTAHGMLILGPEVEAFEKELAAFCGARHVVSCANGTDAMTMVLRAFGVGPGDAVIVPAFTFASTAEVVAGLGATPVFVDIEAEGFAIDPDQIAAGAAAARRAGLRPVGVMPVDMFGQPADYARIEPAAEAEGLWVLVDAAQGFGGRRGGRPVGTFGRATAVSFYPSKPLGAYGDGGAVITDDADLAAILRSIRNHGEGTFRYDHVRIGMNSRLDAIQAAVLRAKLVIFPDEIAARDRAAARYSAALEDIARVPRIAPDATSVWAQYTLRLATDREALRARLAAEGIPTAVHYPKPLHHQEAYAAYPTVLPRLPEAERAAAEVLSLPMHGYLKLAVQDRVIGALRAALVPEAATAV